MVALGQCALDQVAVVDGLPAFAGKERVLECYPLPGGQIATAALALTRLGLSTAFVSSVGDDPAAEAVLAPLREAGVDLGGVRLRPGVPSQLSLILVDRKSGERTVLWHRDPRLSLELSELGREAIVRGRALHLDASDLDVSVWAAGVAREAGMAVCLDADTPAPGIDRLLRRVDYPIVSRAFARSYFGTDSPAEACRGLAALGARLPAVTLGDRGAVGGVRGEIASPAFRVAARDTTGAGDVFHAAFLWALLEGRAPREILRTANAAAAMNCRALGAQGGLPARGELRAFLEAQPEDAEAPPP